MFAFGRSGWCTLAFMASMRWFQAILLSTSLCWGYISNTNFLIWSILNFSNGFFGSHVPVLDICVLSIVLGCDIRVEHTCSVRVQFCNRVAGLLFALTPESNNLRVGFRTTQELFVYIYLKLMCSLWWTTKPRSPFVGDPWHCFGLSDLQKR